MGKGGRERERERERESDRKCGEVHRTFIINILYRIKFQV